MKTSFKSTKQLQTSKLIPKKKLLLKRLLIGAAAEGLIWIIFFMVVKFGSFTVATVNIFAAITIAAVMFLLHKLIILKQYFFRL